MKKLLYIFVAILTLATAFASCETKKEKEIEEAEVENIGIDDSISLLIAQKENELNDMVVTFNEIQDGFNRINEAQGRVAENSEKKDDRSKEAILEDMRNIQQTLELNKQLIANLQQQLKEATTMNDVLRQTLEQTVSMMNAQMETQQAQIADLRKQLADKDITIAQQETAIAELQTNVSELTTENEKRSTTIATQDKELHTAYYVFGTKKELRNERILNDGEVLQQGNFNRDYFTKIDTRVDKVIRLYSKSATLKTNHPAGSYSLDKNAKGQYVLRITDPDKFWSISKYLVIIVK